VEMSSPADKSVSGNCTKGLCINNRFTLCCVLDQSCSSIHRGIRGSGG
jgi:hypothetical protein